MKPKGRVRFASGGVGNDVKYIIELPAESGRRLRLVTDRTISFEENRSLTRSKEYSVGAVDLFLMPDEKGSGDSTAGMQTEGGQEDAADRDRDLSEPLETD